MREKTPLRHNVALLLLLTIALCVLGCIKGMDQLLGDTSQLVRDSLAPRLGRLQQAILQRNELWTGRFAGDLRVIAREEALVAYVNDVRPLGLDLETMRALSSPARVMRESVIAGLEPRLRSEDMRGVRAFADHSVLTRQLLADALRAYRYLRAAVLTPEGETVIATDDQERRFGAGDSAMLRRCAETRSITSLPAYRVADTLRVDVAVPLFADVELLARVPEAARERERAPAGPEGSASGAAPDGTGGVRGAIAAETRVPQGPPVVALLLVTIDLRERMEATAALGAPPDGQDGGDVVTHLLAQQNPDGSLSMLTYTGDSVSMPLQGWEVTGDMVLFDRRSYPGHGGLSYTVGQRLSSTNLFCLVALDESSTLRGLASGQSRHRKLAIGVCVLAAVVLIFLWLGFFLSREKRIRSVEIAADERHNRRRQLEGYLDQEIRLPVVCCDFDHNLLYVNEAFARLAGRYASELRGRPVEELPQDMATNVLQHCEAVWNSGAVHVFEDRICCAGTWRSYRVTACPYEDRENFLAGVIGIYEDVTEREKDRERIAALGEQTVVALHRLVMAGDRHLGRQSALIAELAVLTARLDGENDADTKRLLSVAGRLCRVGMAAGGDGDGVPAGRHVTVAGVVLGSVDFGGLPVTQTISDMYERLDGSGYPRGLTADGIGKPARCLAIADELARTLMPRDGAPRSAEVFFETVMAERPARLDRALLERLRAYLGTPQGRALLTRLLA